MKPKKVSREAVNLFCEKYQDVSPELIIQKEALKTIATVAAIRDEGIDERNQLKAAQIFLDRQVPVKQDLHLQHAGNISIIITEDLPQQVGPVRIEEDDE